MAIIIWFCFLIIGPKPRKMVSFPTPAGLNLSLSAEGTVKMVGLQRVGLNFALSVVLHSG